MIENVGLMDNNNGFEQMLEKNGNVYETENNGNNGYNSYMMGRLGGLLGKWRPTNMQLPTIAPLARNGNADGNIDNDGNNCTNGNDKGNNGNCRNDGNGNGERLSCRDGKGKQSLSVAGLYFVWISFCFRFRLILGSLFCVDIAFFVCSPGHFPKLNNFRAGKCDEIPGYGDGSAGGKMKKLKKSWDGYTLYHCGTINTGIGWTK